MTPGGERLRLERWKSSNNKEERHYFLSSGEYVIGYNPNWISREAIEMLLETEKVSLYVIPAPK